MRITLLTDFGDRDGFIGAMKGVIATRAPNVVVVDLAHHVPHGNIRHASHVLFTTAPFFPAGTCHVAVVDPGVGLAEQRPVAVAVDDQIYIGPDNGILTDVLQSAAGRIMGVHLTNPAFWQHPISNTFHGRDIYAPVAAHVASGVPITACGAALETDTLCRLHQPRVAADHRAARGEVTYVDTFGNCVTNLSRQHVAEVSVEVDQLVVELPSGICCPVEQTYGSVPVGQSVALIGSTGRVELAINGGSAAVELELELGVPVTVRAQ